MGGKKNGKKINKTGDIQGRLCPASEDLGAIGRTQNSQPAVNLSPTCSTHTEEGILSALSSPPPPSPLVLLDLFLGEKRWLMIFWYIFLFMLFWGGCASESFSCSAMLFDLGYFFWSRGVGRKFDTRGFSWWSNELAQTQLFEPPQSERTGPVDALYPRPPPLNALLSSLIMEHN